MQPLADLDLTNYKEHPTHRGYFVFRFKDHQKGEYFESLLLEKKLEYKRTITENEQQMMLFAIRRRDLKQAEHLNNLASARYRKPFIPQRGLRIFTMGLFFFLILLGILGLIFSG